MNVYDDIKCLYNESELYNNEFSNYKDDFSFWKYWIANLSPDSVLEIGIGNGRLVNLLSPLVNRYDGLEFSENIINDFNKKYPKFTGTIYNQDMKKIYINHTYDLIILPFNTFVYLYTLSDIFDFFEGIKRISHQDTLIIIDIFNPTLNDLKDSITYRLCETFKFKKRDCQLYEKHHYDSSKQIIFYQKKYIYDNKKIELNLPVRVFFHQEILNLISMNGFRLIKELGDYNNEKFTSQSRKQILLLKKERCY